MKRLIFLILLTVAALRLSASACTGEEIYIDGEKWFLLGKPINNDSVLYYNLIAALPDNRVEWSTNWDGYWAYWSIHNNRLCLDSIVVNYYDKAKDLDLWECVSDSVMQQVFGSYYVSDTIVASWLTADIRIARGKRIFYMHVGYERNYEEEIILSVEHGIINGRQVYHNRLVTEGFSYSEDPKSVHDRLAQISINVKRYPVLTHEKKIICQVKDIQNDSLGHITDCRMSIILGSWKKMRKITNGPALDIKKQFMQIGPWKTLLINDQYVIPDFRYGFIFPIDLNKPTD